MYKFTKFGSVGEKSLNTSSAKEWTFGGSGEVGLDRVGPDQVGPDPVAKPGLIPVYGQVNFFSTFSLNKVRNATENYSVICKALINKILQFPLAEPIKKEDS